MVTGASGLPIAISGSGPAGLEAGARSSSAAYEIEIEVTARRAARLAQNARTAMLRFLYTGPSN
jgi:hypothetical protein